MMPTSPKALVIGPAAGPLRRRLGPTAWVVLEAVVAHSDSASGTDLAAVSARSLAVELGLVKNTIARGLAALVDAGLLDGVQAHAASGTFGRGSYRLSVPADALAVVSTSGLAHRGARVAGPAAPMSRSASRVAEQLVLLDE